MIASLQPYPEYKESGLSWLGGIPRHWDTGPGFAAFREKRVKNTGMQEKTVLSLSYGRIVVKPPEKLHGLVPESFETYQIVDPGDIIIRSTDLQNDWNSLRVGLVRNRGIITSAYLCFRTAGTLSPEYGYQLLHAFDLMKVFYGLGSGLRQNLDWGDFKRMLIFIPPPEEQAAIVRFLDYANGRLERAIRAKRMVIALLHEQKQAIIHRAVTRGLDPVPLKPSGIPWLGDIPRRWELTKLKHLSPQITVGIVIQPARLYVSKGVPCLRSLNISSGRITTDEMVFISEDSHRTNRKSQLNEGDVVLVRTGRTGVAVIVPPEFHGANCIDLLIIRKTERILSEYLLAYLQSYGAKSDIAFNSVGAIQAHYNTATLANLRIPLPPMPEQQAILRRVELDLAPLTTAITRLEHEISLLREYRTRLVADVVTGKLDERPVASQLPAEPGADLPAVEADESAGEAELEPEAADAEE